MSKNIKIQGTGYNIKSTSGDVEFNLAGNAVISGNLQVDGTTTTVNSETLTIADNIITLNSNVTTGAPLEDAGIEILRGDSNNVELRWQEGVTPDQGTWVLIFDDTETFPRLPVATPGVNAFEVIHRGITGAGSGFDADLLDGYDSEEFAVRAENELITGRYTFNESGTDTYNIAPNNDTIVNIDGTTTTALSYKLGGFTRMDNILSSTDFTLSRHDGAGVLIDAPLNINLADGTIDLVSATLLRIDTPLIKGADGVELTIQSGSSTTPTGNDLRLQGGDGASARGSIVLNSDVIIDHPTTTTNKLSAPTQLDIITDAGNIVIDAGGVTTIHGYTYPDILDGTTPGYVVQDLAGNGILTLAELSLETLLTNNPSTAENNEIMKRSGLPAPGQWEYIADFRRVYQDPEPFLGASLNVNGFEITSTELDVLGSSFEDPDPLIARPNGSDIVINPFNTGSVVLGNTTDGVVRLKAAESTALTIESGSHPTTGNGEDLRISGGTSIIDGAPKDGAVLLGRSPNASKSILRAGNDQTDMNIEVGSGQNIVLGATSAIAGTVIGPYSTAIAAGTGEGDLTLSGGEALATNNYAGDLILQGGLSNSGGIYDGKIIFDSPVVFSSPIPTVGAVYPINLFIPDLLTTGLNGDIVLDSFGVTETTVIQPTGHVGYANVPPTFNTTYFLRKISTQGPGAGTITEIGTVTFNAGTEIAATISITNNSLQAGDLVQVRNPPGPDAAINDITITLRTITA